MPIPAQMAQAPMFANAKGIKSVIDLGKVSANPNVEQETVDIKKLGTTEKIAGYDCEDYEITPSKGEPMRACIAQKLGHFLFPSMGSPMGRGPTGAPGGSPVGRWWPAG